MSEKTILKDFHLSAEGELRLTFDGSTFNLRRCLPMLERLLGEDVRFIIYREDVDKDLLVEVFRDVLGKTKGKTL